LNNIVEQDQAIKRRVNAKQRFREFQAAQRTIQGLRGDQLLPKGQVRCAPQKDLPLSSNCSAKLPKDPVSTGGQRGTPIANELERIL